jgi:hypothetical protein
LTDRDAGGHILTMPRTHAPPHAQIQRIRRAERRMLIILAREGKLPGVNAVRRIQADYRPFERMGVRSALEQNRWARELRDLGR